MIRFAAPISFFCLAAAFAAAADDGFVTIFDGKSFSGWEGDTEKTFRIEKGAIVAGSLNDRVPRNEFLCTEKEYGDFELRFEAKLVGEGTNAGVQFRSKRIPNHHEVIGYQCDIGTTKDRSIWGSLYDESRRRKFLADGDAEKLANTVRDGEWNRLVVRCQGPRIQIWVNDLKTVDYTEEDDQIERRGIIGLQIHGGPPAEASYRNISLKTID